MSLFSKASPSNATAAPPQAQHSFFAPPAQDNFGSWGGGVTSSAPPVQQSNQAFIGGAGAAGAGAGVGGWGGMQMEQNAWGAPSQPQQQQQPAQPQTQQYQYQQPPQHQPQQPASSGANLWGAAPTNDPWASAGNGTASAGGFGAFGGAAPQKKEEVDPFANIWK